MRDQKFWFKAKKHGWGWTPAGWQGWSIIILYILAVIQIFVRADQDFHDFLPLFFLATFVLVLICYLTGKK